MASLPTQYSSDHLVLRGLPIVSGIAMGQLFFYRNSFPHVFKQKVLAENEVEDELKRIQLAIDKICDELSLLKSKVASQIDTKHAEIFESHFRILTDIALFKDIEQDLKSRLLNAENIVQDVFLRWENRLRSSSSSEISERADDIQDLARRMLDKLCGVVRQEMAIELPVDPILFVKKLLPSDVASLDLGNIKAIITEEGTRNSHSSILARAMDIPLVSKINVDGLNFASGTRVIVDGKHGQIIFNPLKNECGQYAELIQKKIEYKANLMQHVKDVTLSNGKTIIRVKANVSGLSELKMAKKLGADGIGLYRTEVFYMGRTAFPSEEDFYDQLKISLGLVPGNDVALRLLDIGGDKMLPFLDPDEFPNPVLGRTGIRLLFKFPRILEMQLRVFLRLSAEFHVKVLVPMVTLPRDMIEVRRYLQREKEKLYKEGIPFDQNLALGAMIETPAAVLAIDELMELADFFDIGTNDLVQFVMAAGRGREDVADYYEAGNYLVLEMIKGIIQKAKIHRKDCGVCGELAGDLNFTKDLLNIGLTDFSVQPALIPYVKHKVFQLLAENATLKPLVLHSDNLGYLYKDPFGIVGVSERKYPS